MFSIFVFFSVCSNAYSYTHLTEVKILNSLTGIWTLFSWLHRRPSIFLENGFTGNSCLVCAFAASLFATSLCFDVSIKILLLLLSKWPCLFWTTGIMMQSDTVPHQHAGKRSTAKRRVMHRGQCGHWRTRRAETM